MIRGPRPVGRSWLWEGRQGEIEVRFLGRAPAASRQEVLRRIGDEPGAVAWARQLHSARVLIAGPGPCGSGDALVSPEAGLALSVVTADCVPLLLAGGDRVAAIHAGWRGIAAGIVGAALSALEAEPAGSIAWIGPAIGACCYEVGPDVASQIAAVSSPRVVTPGRRDRPHLDLPGAVAQQLREAGVGDLHLAIRCTRCDGRRLASYRRQGKRPGRNLAFIWRRGAVREPQPRG